MEKNETLNLISFEKVLPSDIWLEIFSHLSQSELYNICLVSRYWNLLGSQDILWKAHFFRRFRQMPWNTRSLKGSVRSYFIKKQKIKLNWQNMQSKMICWEAHRLGVLDVKLGNGFTLASSSLDKTIKIWNWKDKKLLTTLQGHRGGGLSYFKFKMVVFIFLKYSGIYSL